VKVLAFGSRGLRDERLVRAVIHGLSHTRPGGEGFHLIAGAAAGADELAAKVARELDWAQVREYPAQWREHAEGWCPGQVCTGRSPRVSWWCMVAGPRRNQQMIDEEHTADAPIDLGVGFIDKPLKRSKGSADMHRRLMAARIPTMVVWCPPVITDDRAEHAQEPIPKMGAYEQAPLLRFELPPGVVPAGEPALDRLGRHKPIWAPDAK
jgi:hypothetical protein